MLALAGEPDDLDAARRALDTVDRASAPGATTGPTCGRCSSAGWPPPRSAWATGHCCAELLAELEPVADACGVSGALVCFVGSNAHWAGILAGALGRVEDAHRWLDQALAVHRAAGRAEPGRPRPTWSSPRWARAVGMPNGPRNWPPSSASPACSPDCRPSTPTRRPNHRASRRRAVSRRRTVAGPLPRPPRPTCAISRAWPTSHALLARPGTDVHVLELAGAGHADPASGTLLDATARAAYRRRLAELDQDLAAARADHDIGRAQHLDNQRAALIAELRRAAGLAGRSRSLGTSTTERARKAVTARLREAIRRIEAVLPELGAHLDRSVITGTTCRYQPSTPMTWKLEKQ